MRLMEDVTGIRVFHGSPHDFAEFQTVAIGTGEGAQAFGHGMYFADSERLAIAYRDRLSRDAGGHIYEVRLLVDPLICCIGMHSCMTRVQRCKKRSKAF
jgi:hypothetical protein